MSNSDSRIARSPVPAELCGMAHAADLLGDRWSLLILRALHYGVSRFDDLKADMGISSATLSERLTALAGHGLIATEPYREPGARPRNAYVLTQAGREFGVVLFAMMGWADKHLGKAPSPLKLVERTSGKKLRLALVDPEGRAVDFKQAEMRVAAK